MISGIGIFTIILLLAIPIQTNEIKFNLPPLSVSGVTEIPDITCTIQAKLFEIDSSGKTIDVTSSGSFSGHPFFAVIDQFTGKKVAGWTVIPSANCGNDNVGGTEVQLEITNTMSAKWQVKSPEISFWGEPFSQQKKTGSKVTTSQRTFPEINYFGVYAQDAENRFVGGGVKDLRVVIEGLLTINYKGFPNIKYHFIIPTIPINTQFKIVLPERVPDERTRDTDGDGIIDQFDQCKFQQEVYNGFRDGDGCPDKVSKIVSRVVQDTDSDHIPDDVDECVFRQETFNGYKDGDGCPDSIPSVAQSGSASIAKPTLGRNILDTFINFFLPIDTDKDGIPDDRDDCIVQPETYNGVDDFDGCPDAVTLADIPKVIQAVSPITYTPLGILLQSIVDFFLGR